MGEDSDANHENENLEDHRGRPAESSSKRLLQGTFQVKLGPVVSANIEYCWTDAHLRISSVDEVLEEEDDRDEA